MDSLSFSERNENTNSIFCSHSKLDKKICNDFDSVATRVGIRVFRSEYEDFEKPAWLTIKTEIQRSKALFLLIGKELIKAQKENRRGWKYTQNWIAYEVGVACASGIDVWVITEKGGQINFPVPYLNNYSTTGLENEELKWKANVLLRYLNGENFGYGYRKDKAFTCPNERCGAKFNYHSVVELGKSVICPTCLTKISLPDGWRKQGTEQ